MNILYGYMSKVATVVVTVCAGPGADSGSAASAPRPGGDAGDESGSGVERGRGQTRGTAGKSQDGVRRDAVRTQTQAQRPRHFGRHRRRQYIRFLPVAKEVMFLSAFVCLFASRQDYAKTTQPILTKFGVKATHGPRR